MLRRVWLLTATSLLLVAGCSDDSSSNSKTTDGKTDMSTATSTSTTTTEVDMAQVDMSVDETDMSVEADMEIPAPDMTDWTEEQKAVWSIEETERWSLPTLQKEVQVLFTENGRPHLYAQNRRDLGVVLGFTVARDRYFFMDLARRLGQGTLSSILGDLALPNDINSRMTGMRFVTQRILDNLSKEDGEFLDAYAEGINAYVQSVKDKTGPRPSELTKFKGLLGKRFEYELMEEFSREDIAAMVAVIMYQTNFDTSDPGQDKAFQDLATLYDTNTTLTPDAKLFRRQAARQDFWQRGIEPIFDAHSASGWEIEGAVTTKSLVYNPSPKKVGSATGDGSGIQPALKVPSRMLGRAAARLRRFESLLGRREIDNFGSNTWAVAGTHAKDGEAVVAGDGHLPLSVPALMYQVGMDTKVFGGQMQQAGLLIAGLPVLAVGTNGKIAWSQVNPVSDITDWYAEEIRLDDKGAPAQSLFQGEWKSLNKVDETYEIAEVAATGSVGRTETWSRWTTFDGRWLFELEGREVEKAEDAKSGETVVNLEGKLIVPQDMNNDGKISALSFDYVAFDTTKYMDALVGFTRSETVEEYQEYSKGLVGNMLYAAVVDEKGGLLFTSYQAVPCRTYLERDGEDWAPGSNPTLLLDGTKYGGFTIPTLPDGKADESQNQSDPYRCVVPFSETPQALNPKQGFVLNANNQPAPIVSDASLANDPWYIGGPWSAMRADSIEQDLIEVTKDKAATIEDMANIQGNMKSRIGELYVPHFLAAIDNAKALLAKPNASPTELRVAKLYSDNQAEFDEVRSRLEDWRTTGQYDTHSGVKTFYNTPDEQRQKNAVATMIFNAWMPRTINLTFGDEDLRAWFSGSRSRMRTLYRMMQGRGDNNTQLASFSDETKESVFFDNLNTPEVESGDEVILLSLVDALTFLKGEPAAKGEGGFGTEDMSKWLWGLRHQVRFESLLLEFLQGTMFESFANTFSITTNVLPLDKDIPDGDPRKDLKWFPRPGDNWGVDAANPGFSGTRFTHGSGPVMRMVISIKDGVVKGQNIIPGGQSGLNYSPYFADQAKAWLGNTTVPLRYHPDEVVEGATGRARFMPAKK